MPMKKFVFQNELPHVLVVALWFGEIATSDPSSINLTAAAHKQIEKIF